MKFSPVITAQMQQSLQDFETVPAVIKERLSDDEAEMA